MLAIINEAFGWLKDFSSSPWFYLIIFAIAVLDSVLPIVPSETLVIIGGVSAGLGNLWIPLVIVVADERASGGNHNYKWYPQIAKPSTHATNDDQCLTRNNWEH